MRGIVVSTSPGLTRKSRPLTPQFKAAQDHSLPTVSRVTSCACPFAPRVLAHALARAASTVMRAALVASATAVLLAGPRLAQADDAPAVATPGGAGAELDALLGPQVQHFVDLSAAEISFPGRVQIEVGRLDPRLRLAPCDRVEPYVPTGARLWGRSRIGLRCAQGTTRWNVFLPITVKVMARALTAATALPAGSVLGPADLVEAEFDLAAEPGSVYDEPQSLVGRVLARPVVAGQALRSTQLRPRQWFATGEVVRLIAEGDGYVVGGAGEALGPGVEGQMVRVRTEGGRVVTGTAVAPRLVRLAM